MTRKDYELLAEVIRINLNRARNAIVSGDSAGEAKDAIRELRDDLMIELHRDNPRFDRDKFIKASGG